MYHENFFTTNNILFQTFKDFLLYFIFKQTEPIWQFLPYFLQVNT